MGFSGEQHRISNKVSEEVRERLKAKSRRALSEEQLNEMDKKDRLEKIRETLVSRIPGLYDSEISIVNNQLNISVKDESYLNNALKVLGVTPPEATQYTEDVAHRSRRNIYKKCIVTLNDKEIETAFNAIQEQEKEIAYLKEMMGFAFKEYTHRDTIPGAKNDISVEESDGKIIYRANTCYSKNFHDNPAFDPNRMNYMMGVNNENGFSDREISQENLRKHMIEQRLVKSGQEYTEQRQSQEFDTPTSSEKIPAPNTQDKTEIGHNPAQNTYIFRTISRSLDRPAKLPLSDNMIESLTRKTSQTQYTFDEGFKEIKSNMQDLPSATMNLVKNAKGLKPMKCKIVDGKCDITLPDNYTGKVCIPRVNQKNEPIAYDILVYNNGNIMADSIIHESHAGKCLVQDKIIKDINDAKSRDATHAQNVVQQKHKTRPTRSQSSISW